jgi:hypothetical protein
LKIPGFRIGFNLRDEALRSQRMLASTSALNRMGYNPRSSAIPKQCLLSMSSP